MLNAGTHAKVGPDTDFATVGGGKAEGDAVTIIETLASAGLFAELDAPTLATIADAASEVSYQRGDVLFRETDDATSLYLMVSGRVAIVNRSVDGRESMIALMEQGDLFGEMSLFDNQGRSAEARALESSAAIEVPYEPVRAVYDADPSQLWGVVRLFSERLRSMDAALADSVFLDVTGRTAKRLLEIAGSDDSFTLPLTQEELAGMVGASRERVNKSIAQFIKLGWLNQTSPGGYTITNRKELEIRAS